MITAGIDIGSAGAKAIILKDDSILDWSIMPTMGDSIESATTVMKLLLDKTGLSLDDINYILATGYGRVNVPFAKKEISEITCHATGAFWQFPETRTILDIGGQDVKAIKVNDKGMVTKFLLNDKCAAGTGRYLERISATFGMNLKDIGPMALQATADPLPEVSSTCTVFATEEMTWWLRRGEDPKNIIAGATKSLVERLTIFVDRIGLEESLMVTGGVAKNIGVITFVEKQLGMKPIIAPEPQITGALGAAILASREAKKLATSAVSGSESDSEKSNK